MKKWMFALALVLASFAANGNQASAMPYRYVVPAYGAVYGAPFYGYYGAPYGYYGAPAMSWGPVYAPYYAPAYVARVRVNYRPARAVYYYWP